MYDKDIFKQEILIRKNSENTKGSTMNNESPSLLTLFPAHLPCQVRLLNKIPPT